MTDQTQMIDHMIATSTIESEGRARIVVHVPDLDADATIIVSRVARRHVRVEYDLGADRDAWISYMMDLVEAIRWVLWETGVARPGDEFEEVGLERLEAIEDFLGLGVPETPIQGHA